MCVTSPYKHPPHFGQCNKKDLIFPQVYRKVTKNNQADLRREQLSWAVWNGPAATGKFRCFASALAGLERGHLASPRLRNATRVDLLAPGRIEHARSNREQRTQRNRDELRTFASERQLDANVGWGVVDVEVIRRVSAVIDTTVSGTI